MGKRRAIINIVDNKVFNTMTAAEAEYGIPSGMVSEAIKYNRAVHGQQFKFLDAVQKEVEPPKVIIKEKPMSAITEVKPKKVDKYINARNTVKTLTKTDRRKYKCVIAWWMVFHPDEPWYLNSYLKRAKVLDAKPDDVFVNSDGTWSKLASMNNEPIRVRMDEALAIIEESLVQ